MKLPIKPKAPSKPSEPKTHYPRQPDITEWLGYDDKYTLEEMLAKLPAGSKSSDLVFLVRSYQSGADRSGYADYDYEYGLQCIFTIQEENKDYAKDVKKHEKAIVKFEEKMKEHKSALIKYEEEIKVYRVWEKEEKSKQDVKDLEKLKKAVKALEKKVAK